MELLINNNALEPLNELKKLGNEKSVFKIRMKGYTWSGVNVDVVLVEQEKDMKIYLKDEFRFFIDTFLEEKFSQVIIEYTDSWFKKGFVVRVKD